MNYSALIENRKSVRAFQNKRVPASALSEIENYYENHVKRLVPEIKTELLFLDDSTREALEGAAGYNSFLVGSHHYLILLSEKHDLQYFNAGYIMEDLILKLTDMDLDSCWVTFTSSDDVKQTLGLNSDLEIVAIAAFGYGVKTSKRLRLNIRSMSNIDIIAKRHYTEPKRSIYDMVFLNTWGNTDLLDEYIGFFDDFLWEAFHAAALSPSYLNRQAYGFILHDGALSLIARPDEYTTDLDGELSLGIVLHHFTETAAQWAGRSQWKFGTCSSKLELPDGHKVIATTVV